MGIHVLIVSEVRFFREGLAGSLASRGGIGAAAGGLDIEAVEAVAPASAVRAAERLHPDVVLLHVGMPAGPDLARTIAVLAPEAATIALAVEDSEASVLAWAEAGVAGYVSADGSMSQVVEAVQVVGAGGAACPPVMIAVLLERIARLGPVSAARRILTDREIEIARLVEEGLSNKEIARALSISIATVKNHVHHILAKLQVDRRSRISTSDGPVDRN